MTNLDKVKKDFMLMHLTIGIKEGDSGTTDAIAEIFHIMNNYSDIMDDPKLLKGMIDAVKHIKDTIIDIGTKMVLDIEKIKIMSKILSDDLDEKVIEDGKEKIGRIMIATNLLDDIIRICEGCYNGRMSMHSEYVAT